MVREVNAVLGHGTNSEAEYQGLLRALAELKKIGARRIEVFTDSEFVVKQVLGLYKARDERMKILLAQVKELGKDFNKFKVTHVSRSSHIHNKRVDELANWALDGRIV